MNTSQVTTFTAKIPGDVSSDRELSKNGPITLNKHVGQTRNTLATYLYGYAMGNPYIGGRGIHSESEDIVGTSKQSVKKMLEDLVQKKPEITIDKFSDFNDNKISDINEIGDETVIDKTTNFLKSIQNLENDEKFNANEKLAIVMNYILTNIDMGELSRNHKNILKKLI